jgi:NAD(P)-dependent dehydrogenase (short-subunit alcohol dehydrogenase family)
MSNFSLQGKTSIITGGAGGLGRAMVAAYAAAGANVVVASRNQEKIEVEAAGIRDKGQSAIAIAADITDSEQVEHLVSKTVETFGALDVMVNNAGRWGRSHLAEETPLEEWRIVVDQNLTGVFIPCMAAGKQMIRQQFGKIINISSTAGSKGNPHQLHYSAAKAGVISLTNNLAYMWAKHNINVNCILPGLIATEELKGYGIIPTDTDDDGNAIPKLELTPNPENVADLALFLASPASDALTGELYPIRAWLKSERFWQ